MNANWNTNTSIGTWFKVTCDNGNLVTGIVLESNNLVGWATREIYHLSILQVLNFKDNQLSDAGFEGFIEQTGTLLTLLQLGENSLTQVKDIKKAPASLQ